MSRGIKIIIFIVVGIGIIAAILWFAFGRRDSPNTPALKRAQATMPTKNETGGEEPPANAIPAAPPAPLSEAQQTEANLRTLAVTFAERYGSYSNQSNYQNIRDVLPLATVRFRAILGEQLSAPPSAGGGYSGVSSVALRTTTQSFDAGAGAAVILVATQRKNDDSLGATRTSYETLTLTFRTESGSWRVDNAQWKKS